MNKNCEEVIWVGPLVKYEDLKNSKALSPAANVWQLAFIKGLIENGINVFSLSYIPYPSWPKGPLMARSHKTINNVEGLKQRSVSYLNVKGVREFSLFSNLYKAVKESKNKLIFTYNPLPRHVQIAQKLRKIEGCKWVSIVADDIPVGNPDYITFLSYDSYLNANEKNKLFFDGGFELRKSEPDTKEGVNDQSPTKKIIYAGSLNKWTGIKEFIKVFAELNDDDFSLEIYGKGDEQSLKKEIQKVGGQNISVHGFVSEDKLTEVCNKAWAFINPRPMEIDLGENNFPSKLLLYMPFYKPVISTKTKGLSPDFDNVLIYYKNVEDLRGSLEQLKNSQYYEENSRVMKKFVINNIWNKRIEQFLNRLNDL